MRKPRRPPLLSPYAGRPRWLVTVSSARQPRPLLNAQDGPHAPVLVAACRRPLAGRRARPGFRQSRRGSR